MRRARFRASPSSRPACRSTGQPGIRGELVRASARLAGLCTDTGSELIQLHAPALAAGAPFPVPAVAVHHSCVATWWSAVKPGERLPADFRWRTELTAPGPVGRGCGHRSHRRLRRGRRGDLWPAGAPCGGAQRPQPSAGAPTPGVRKRQPGSCSPPAASGTRARTSPLSTARRRASTRPSSPPARSARRMEGRSNCAMRARSAPSANR